MSTTSFTPGPWRADQRQIIAPKSEESRGGLVATCRGSAHTRTIANANANARLIAAAPELFEMLEIAIKDGPAGYLEWIDAAKDVLAKARGES